MTDSTVTTAEDPAPPPGAPQALLEVAGLEVVYNDVVLVLRGVSLTVPVGGVITVLGGNGAGKTTLLRSITGLLNHHRGRVVKGRVRVDGVDVTGSDPARVVRQGVAQVMEGRRSFAELTVDENLRCGAITVRDKTLIRERHDRVMELFPVLKERRRSTAGYLSGGEQQMLVIGRALMSGPRLLLLDEPSLGLAPMIVEQIGHIIRTINQEGTSVLLVEQNATMALSLSQHGYVMETGRIVRDGPAQELLDDKDIQEFYLGSAEGSRSFRSVKTYRRRRRWGG